MFTATWREGGMCPGSRVYESALVSITMTVSQYMDREMFGGVKNILPLNVCPFSRCFKIAAKK